MGPAFGPGGLHRGPRQADKPAGRNAMRLARPLGLPRRRPGNLLLRPATQLKLPAYVLAVTLCFTAVWVVHAWVEH